MACSKLEPSHPRQQRHTQWRCRFRRSGTALIATAAQHNALAKVGVLGTGCCATIMPPPATAAHAEPANCTSTLPDACRQTRHTGVWGTAAAFMKPPSRHSCLCNHKECGVVGMGMPDRSTTQGMQAGPHIAQQTRNKSFASALSARQVLVTHAAPWPSCPVGRPVGNPLQPKGQTVPPNSCMRGWCTSVPWGCSTPPHCAVAAFRPAACSRGLAPDAHCTNS